MNRCLLVSVLQFSDTEPTRSSVALLRTIGLRLPLRIRRTLTHLHAHLRAHERKCDERHPHKIQHVHEVGHDQQLHAAPDLEVGEGQQQLACRRSHWSPSSLVPSTGRYVCDTIVCSKTQALDDSTQVLPPKLHHNDFCCQ